MPFRRNTTTTNSSRRSISMPSKQETRIPMLCKLSFFFILTVSWFVWGCLLHSSIVAKNLHLLMLFNGWMIDNRYDPLCYHGVFHSVAEDSHWSPFQNATFNYIRQKYPKPWDEATEMLVAFSLGFVSHQVADVLWHSLGIQQGFLSTMGYVSHLTPKSSPLWTFILWWCCLLIFILNSILVVVVLETTDRLLWIVWQRSQRWWPWRRRDGLLRAQHVLHR